MPDVMAGLEELEKELKLLEAVEIIESSNERHTWLRGTEEQRAQWRRNKVWNLWRKAREMRDGFGPRSVPIG